MDWKIGSVEMYAPKNGHLRGNFSVTGFQLVLKRKISHYIITYYFPAGSPWLHITLSVRPSVKSVVVKDGWRCDYNSSEYLYGYKDEGPLPLFRPSLTSYLNFEVRHTCWTWRVIELRPYQKFTMLTLFLMCALSLLCWQACSWSCLGLASSSPRRAYLAGKLNHKAQGRAETEKGCMHP